MSTLKAHKDISVVLLTGIHHGFYILGLLWQLIVQWAVGVWVIARCFLDRRQFEEDISSKLGSSFSVAPFLCVVVCVYDVSI